MNQAAELSLDIDWTRLAEPQPGGYDTSVILELRPKQRAVSDTTRFCDDLVAVRQGPKGVLTNPALAAAPLDHPNIPVSASLLARWPAAYEQFKQLVDTVYLYVDEQQARMGDLSLGSSSHSRDEEFGTIYVTVDNALGCAQALVHEMAHHKLRALGVRIETADRLITNPPDQMFVSPIRKDRARPMTAVFHAQYSFIHVTALDLFMLEQAKDEREHAHILMLLARNVPRMQAGYEEIAKHIRTDKAGDQFVQAFMQWAERVQTTGQAILDANGYGAV